MPENTNIDAQHVRAALDQIEAGEADAQIFETIVQAASAWAALQLIPEWGFDGAETGIKYVTTNAMMAEVMQAAKPDAAIYFRYAPAWVTRTDIQP